MANENHYLDKIDDYKDTVFSIIGFMNIYRFDEETRKIDPSIIVFQGRKFNKKNELTEGNEKQALLSCDLYPDFGIVLASKYAVLGEVKKSFPQDTTLWQKTFDQLLSYDHFLEGWPTDDGTVTGNDLVLLLHQSRSAAVKRFYEERRDISIKFVRPFAIIEFNRSNERQAYFFFRKEYGELSTPTINQRLADGIQVPMRIFVDLYSTIKLYDGKPPLPYLMELIWTHIVNFQASSNPKYQGLRKNQKIDITITVDNIIDELHEKFSFYQLHKDLQERQPKIPEREWVIEACETLVKYSMAKWISQANNNDLIVYFKKYDNIQNHFISICSEDDQKGEQIELFNKSRNT